MKLVAIVGPTGTGKSDLSLVLADRLRDLGRQAEIVNADAMQLYRGMDIGTAKVPESDRRGIPHHLLDVLDVTEEATVAAYQRDARAAIEAVLARDAVPILVGGSGLYVSSVLFDFRFPGRDPATRARLEAEAAEQGSAALHRRLAEHDPSAAEAIGPHNVRRLIRALEVVELTGERPQATLPDAPRPWRPHLITGLRAPRDELVARLDDRVRRMWRAGLLAEVAGLAEHGLGDGVTARQAIGYAQALAQLAGRLGEEEAIAETQRLTRRYARRQVSWFRRYSGVLWLDYDGDDLVDRIVHGLDEPGEALRS